MNPKRLAAIDRKAREVIAEFGFGHDQRGHRTIRRWSVPLSTERRADDLYFSRDVVTRVRQILEGDDLPISHLNADD